MTLKQGIVVLLTVGAFAPAFAETIQGRVIDNNTGSPVLSTDVRVRDAATRKVFADLDTDASGGFRSPDLPAGQYLVEVSRPGFLPSSTQIEVAAGSGVHQIAFPLVRFGVFSGRVTDQQGRLVPGAIVFALPASGSDRSSLYYNNKNAMVNARGEYRLYDIPPGRYVLAVSWGASTMQVSMNGFNPGSPGSGSGVRFYADTFTLTGGEQIHADFTVGSGVLSSVSGKLQLPDEKRSMWLALTPVAHPELASVVTETKADGSFEFTGVAPGEYNLLASGPVQGRSLGAMLVDDPFFGRSTVTVAGQNVDGLSVPLEHGRSAAVTLQRTAQECPETARLNLEPAEDWAAMITGRAGLTVDHPETIEHLAPARYRVRLSIPGGRCYQTAIPVLDLSASSPQEPVVVTIAPAATVRGRVSTQAEVAIVAVDVADTNESSRAVMTDADSRFEFTGLRPGRYRITVRQASPPFAKSDFETEVGSGASRTLDLEVPKP